MHLHLQHHQHEGCKVAKSTHSRVLLSHACSIPCINPRLAWLCQNTTVLRMNRTPPALNMLAMAGSLLWLGRLACACVCHHTVVCHAAPCVFVSNMLCMRRRPPTRMNAHTAQHSKHPPHAAFIISCVMHKEGCRKKLTLANWHWPTAPSHWLPGQNNMRLKGCNRATTRAGALDGSDARCSCT